ncbi:MULTISPECIES: copper resistance CopC/CopD family protein [Rhodomicrobium]|uniref:copper resistance CopC/CopD family protein n=1 Tax=Rhodomicrobium TaxID=1068 RepID=UPI000B4A8D47|nr:MULTISPECIES: copper resistance CopC/CopD family protein [Rhodomicrobium]
MRRIALILLAMAALLASGAPAFAHAALVGSEPADDGVVAAAPQRLTLTFNQPIAPLVLKLIRPDGSAVALDHFALEGNRLSIDAPPGLGAGTHALSWRVVSEDGHPVGGSLLFSIGAPSAGPLPDIDEAVDWPVRRALWAARVLLYAGLFFGVGGAFFAAWIGDGGRGARSLAAGVMGLGLLAVGISVGLQGVDALGASLDGLGRRIVWATGFATSFGDTASLAAIALVGGLLALLPRGWPAKALSLLALIAVGLALAASGHASAAPPQWLTRPAVFLHGIAIAFWAGSLIPLATLLATNGPDSIAALRRFSASIPFAILPLLAAGILLAFVQVQSPDALWTTAYGQILLIKLALLLALLAFAAANRYRFTHRTLGGDVGAFHILRRSILIETALMLAIFGVAAAWRFTPPPRALAEAAAKPAAIHIHTAKAMADFTLTPGRAGTTTASIFLMTGDFGPLAARELTLVLANPTAGIEPIRRPATRPGDGTWAVDGLTIPQAGRWQVELEILVTDFELLKLDGEIDIRR